MSKSDHKKYLLNYYAMAILFAMMLMAFKLSGILVAILCLLALLLVSPVIVIPGKVRWLLVAVLFVAIILLYPDISQLKEMEGL